MMDGKPIELDFMTSEEEDSSDDNDKFLGFKPKEPRVHLADLQPDLAKFIYCKVATDFQTLNNTDWLNNTNFVLRLDYRDFTWVEKTKLGRERSDGRENNPFLAEKSLDVELRLAFEEQARRFHWMPAPEEDRAWTQAHMSNIGQEEEVTQDDIKLFKVFLKERGIDYEALPIDLEGADKTADGEGSDQDMNGP